MASFQVQGVDVEHVICKGVQAEEVKLHHAATGTTEIIWRKNAIVRYAVFSDGYIASGLPSPAGP